ncbi:cytokine-induced anti-apoptosis inhibitor fe-s biogenesis [Nannochloropsis gaditana CCMP526]|uniref:cytokine-induced anti-apoptosis inhibitor fe-s biogenesis n=1 Tax=Nannochloropsis gaditana (strain CCMP526) TaxID=1093141 RepID=UPI00029F6C71|nr:cytokine-induced anti-apoptosis inhibitor fe-s biogenesis [Nannochloropsis gaditana CCMP526]EKU21445.1 cytokine-induced anti-apoptosis inhibitor fe-s biogenesis [Nannochloropsis gaditana CCMP526]|eukprot:XP_005854916.1 cytokine-induced anti-apoptosis inhibitor fe-s biogenesis [Nannochloropsis gaditana CCMP526]
MSGSTIILYDHSALETKASDLSKEINSYSHVQSLISFTPNTTELVKKVIVFLSTVADAASPGTEAALKACFEALAPEGELVVKLCSSDAGDGEAKGGKEETCAGMKMQLLLAGFVDVEVLPASASSSASLIAHKPQWEVGAAASVSLPVSLPRPASSSSSSSTGQSAATWRLTDVDGEGGEEGGAEGELIDPDSLLEDAEVMAGLAAKRAEREQGQGCETKKRACKNCSCGRAEQEEGRGGVALPVMSEEELEASVSSCGNCYKGDAFRV